MEWKTVMKSLDVNYSKSTIKRILAKHYITKWRAAKRPKITPEIATKRLVFARKYLRWRRRWKRVILSDECSVERGKGHKQAWCFRTPQERWLVQNVQPKMTGKNLSIMVSGCFSGRSGRCDLQVMERDTLSRKGGYSAASYIKVLEEVIPQQYEPGMYFLQDNAKIHTAIKTRKWLRDNTVRLLEIPPYSPDLNGIENVWPRLKEGMYAIDPELDERPKSDVTLEYMATELLPQAWDRIEDKVFVNIIKSYPRRMQAVVDASGWWTKY
jgi:hypothetical protein